MMPDSNDVITANVDAEPADLQIKNEQNGIDDEDVNSAGDEPSEEEETLPIGVVNDLAEPAVEKADTSPEVHSLVVSMKPGHTDITARVFHPAKGWENRRVTMPGRLTVNQVAALLLNVEAW